jgi:hypothetical protein
MTHPGVGPITALAFVLVIESPDRFACGKKIGSYPPVRCSLSLFSVSHNWGAHHFVRDLRAIIRDFSAVMMQLIPEKIENKRA